MSKRLFKNYYNRLIGEGFLRALFCGLTAGFSAVVISALSCWYFAYKEIWLTLVIGLGVTMVTTTIFYFAKYRPDLKAIAQRIDELGLEERVLTMTELEKDDSYIARKQREDTLATLNTVMPKNIKLRFALAVLIALPIAGIFMASASTIYGLHVAGLIPSGRDVLLNITAPVPEEIVISYAVEGGGEVRGSVQQTVKMGDSSSAVVAVADKGWAFSHWEWYEGGVAQVSTQPYRVESVVQEKATYTAVFTELEEYQEEIIGDGESDGEGEGDGDGERSPFPPDGGDPGEDDGDPGVGDGMGGGYDDPRNQYYDGNTPLSGSTYDEERNNGIDKTNQNDDMPEDLKEIIEDYYDTIKK